jgi:hypothetical protein
VFEGGIYRLGQKIGIGRDRYEDWGDLSGFQGVGKKEEMFQGDDFFQGRDGEGMGGICGRGGRKEMIGFRFSDGPGGI